MKWIFWLLLSLYLPLTLASESSVYDFSWLDKDKAVYVLQNRTFRKNGSVYVGATLGMTTSGTFTDANLMQGRAGYFFQEEWGIEFVFSKNNGSTNDNYDNVKQVADVFYRKVEGYTGGMLLWSPFYAKINTFDKIIYFDWFFGLGYASVDTLDNRKEFEPPTSNELTPSSSSGILLATGFRAYLNQNWSVRIDLTTLQYSDEYVVPVAPFNKRDETFKNTDFTVGINYAF